MHNILGKDADLNSLGQCDQRLNIKQKKNINVNAIKDAKFLIVGSLASLQTDAAGVHVQGCLTESPEIL